VAFEYFHQPEKKTDSFPASMFFPRSVPKRPLLVIFVGLMLMPLVLLQSCKPSPTPSAERPNLKPHQQEAILNYTFRDWDGQPVRVSDFRGKIVIVDFWETWCSPCLNAFPGFQQVLDEYPDDLVILAATLGSRDDRETALEFIGRHDYSFYFVDGSGVAPKLGIRGIPFKVVIDREGNVDGYTTGSGGAEYEVELLTSLIRELSPSKDPAP